MISLKTEIQIGKYIIVGAVGNLLNLVLLYLFTDFGGMYYLYSSIISLFIVGLLKFLADKTWTFGESLERDIVREFFDFFSVILLIMVLNIIMLFILTDLLGIYYLISQLIAFIVLGFAGFALNKLWTFRHKRKI